MEHERCLLKQVVPASVVVCRGLRVQSPTSQCKLRNCSSPHAVTVHLGMATMYTSTRTTMGPDRYGQSMQPRQPHRQSSSSQVRFGPGANKDEVIQERQKYLTAKYGADQMRLIRKRLAVEDWLDQQLRRLYDVESETEHYDCIDLDDLLDIDEDRHRRRFIQERIANSRKSPEVVNKFIEELLEKANTL